jgi:hypothetical protein
MESFETTSAEAPTYTIQKLALFPDGNKENAVQVVGIHIPLVSDASNDKRMVPIFVSSASSSSSTLFKPIIANHNFLLGMKKKYTTFGFQVNALSDGTYQLCYKDLPTFILNEEGMDKDSIIYSVDRNYKFISVDKADLFFSHPLSNSLSPNLVQDVLKSVLDPESGLLDLAGSHLKPAEPKKRGRKKGSTLSPKIEASAIIETPVAPLIVEESPIEPVVEESPIEPVVEESSVEPIVEESSVEPVVEESPSEPVVEESPSEPVVEESPSEPVVEESPSEPVVEESPSEPVVEESHVEPVVEESHVELTVDESNEQDEDSPDEDAQLDVVSQGTSVNVPKKRGRKKGSLNKKKVITEASMQPFTPIDAKRVDSYLASLEQQSIDKPIMIAEEPILPIEPIDDLLLPVVDMSLHIADLPEGTKKVAFEEELEIYDQEEERAPVQMDVPVTVETQTQAPPQAPPQAQAPAPTQASSVILPILYQGRQYQTRTLLLENTLNYDIARGYLFEVPVANFLFPQNQKTECAILIDEKKIYLVNINHQKYALIKTSPNTLLYQSLSSNKMETTTIGSNIQLGNVTYQLIHNPIVQKMMLLPVQISKIYDNKYGLHKTVYLPKISA